jgi:hypothetical protein
MCKINARWVSVVFMLMALSIFELYALTPNPIISRNKTIYGSPSNVAILVNGKFGGETWNIRNGSWVAIKLNGNYSKILINWNNISGAWSDSIATATSCKSGMGIPVDYDILKSSNSTDGTDGNWTTALTVRKNIVCARSHAIDFSGSQWMKMSIVEGSGSLDELEVFDITKGNNDIWFFPGTSISAVSYKSNPPVKNFADLITEIHPAFNPAIIRGGIGCINSTGMASDISKYLAATRNCKYWAIEMGTNDAWGGNSYNVPVFKTNMQLIIDSCKANGIQPIIARIIGTDSSKAGWQVHSDFLKAVDSLTAKNNLISGPDLYTYFSTHVSELSDGVHPNAAGGASLCRLWAEKMDSLYSSSTSIDKRHKSLKKVHANTIYATTINGFRVINVKYSGTLSIHSLRGAILEKIDLPANGTYKLDKCRGFCIVKFSSKMGNDIIALSNLF